MHTNLPPQGAFPGADGTEFRTWAPLADALSVAIEGGPTVAMQRAPDGLFTARVPGVRPGAKYQLVFPDGRRRADPASRLQEDSVHGPSTVVDLSFPWTDGGFRGVPVEKLSIYELHVGTFTKEGTFAAAVRELPRLKALGITALELMPVAAWDGPRGWGYDGVLLYATHAPYGGPRELQKLVDAAHAHGLAVILDVVYNHLGPAGNYLRDFGPYFTSKHQTPWGEAVNYDGEGSSWVRAFVIENAVSWVRDFHFDGLRLDAVHGIVDTSSPHLLKELNDRLQEVARAQHRTVEVIAESDLNDPILIKQVSDGGYGLAGQWTDDFHHALHALLTGEKQGYYADYGRLEDLAKSFREAFVFTGQKSAFRRKPHGAPAAGLPGRRFVVAAQNHDQIGNRASGDRLTATLAPDALRLAATATILSPFVPLLYMGEEYAETAPFQYFTSFPDKELGRLVSEGRRREFADFAWGGDVPDPQDPATFERSRLQPTLAKTEPHASILRLYQRLLALRRDEPSLQSDAASDREVTVDAASRTLHVLRRGGGRESLLVLRFSPEAGEAPLPPGQWTPLVDAHAAEFAPGSAHGLGKKPLAGSAKLGPWHAALLLKAG